MRDPHIMPTRIQRTIGKLDWWCNNMITDQTARSLCAKMIIAYHNGHRDDFLENFEALNHRLAHIENERQDAA